jgi:hypothetical protein
MDTLLDRLDNDIDKLDSALSIASLSPGDHEYSMGLPRLGGATAREVSWAPMERFHGNDDPRIPTHWRDFVPLEHRLALCVVICSFFTAGLIRRSRTVVSGMSFSGIDDATGNSDARASAAS